MALSKARAKEVFDQAAATSAANPASINEEWAARIERLSASCEQGFKTHIAFIGTALLAKAVSVQLTRERSKREKAAGELTLLAPSLRTF